MNDNYVSVPFEEWVEMRERLCWLDALEAAGVDNWEGCGYAQEVMKYDESE